MPTMRLRVAPASASSGCADGERTGHPVSSFPRLRRPAGERVSPGSAPSGVSAAASPGYPGSCGSGWVDDDSPARLELCILSRAADESSHRSGLCTSPPDSGWLLHRAGAASLPDEPAAKCPLDGFPIVLPGWNCVSSCLQGHQLKGSVGRRRLWIQVQNVESSVDFTIYSAEIERGCPGQGATMEKRTCLRTNIFALR